MFRFVLRKTSLWMTHGKQVEYCMRECTETCTSVLFYFCFIFVALVKIRQSWTNSRKIKKYLNGKISKTHWWIRFGTWDRKGCQDDSLVST